MSSTTLTHRLRSATRAEHLATDRAVLASEPFTDLHAYAAFIAGLAASHVVIEASLRDHTVTHTSGHRPKAQLAELDHATLETQGVQRPDAPLMRPDLGPGRLDRHRAAGWLYVIEGSTLGGVHLAGLARRRLPSVGHATRFLEAYGDQVDERWDRTMTAIDRSGADPDRAIGAALVAFRFVRSGLMMTSR